MRPVELALGWALDWILGDPEPHPVSWIGRAIQRLEAPLRRNIPDARKAGVALLLLVAGGTWVLSWGLVAMAAALHPLLGVLASGILFFFAISLKTLDREVREVARRLAEADLEGARLQVSRIVGRDTGEMDEAGVARAAVESVAESSVDGVLAPLCFAALGGGALAMTYRAVNTLDSMVGHKDERYRDFGWASARLDDVLNWIPARLSGVLLVLSASLAGEDASGAWRVFRRDRLNHASPNAGHPEAAVAGALGLRLGGPCAYGGEVVDKPWMGGEGTETATAAHVLRALRLVHAASFLALGACLALTIC